tara:strand:+ start:473 stop:1072 length:600 start_codon:yes stop_codon:yes gene_type:complete
MGLNGARLGELLLEEDVLTKRQLNKALAMQASGDDRKLGEILIELKYITIDDLTDIMLNHGPQSRWKEQEQEVVKEEVMKKQPVDLSEDAVMKTKFALDVKTMISAAVGIASLVGMWYALQADIQEAKELPNLESLYSEEYPSRPEGYNWPRSYEQYKDNVEGLQDEMDDAYGKIEELQEIIKELQQDIKSLERRKRDK